VENLVAAAAAVAELDETSSVLTAEAAAKMKKRNLWVLVGSSLTYLPLNS